MEFSDESLSKIYRTRVGSKVIIYSINGGGERPVHGAYYDGIGEWLVASWTKDGYVYDGQIRNLDIVREG